MTASSTGVKSVSSQAPSIGALNHYLEVSLPAWIETSGMAFAVHPSKGGEVDSSLVVTKWVLRERMFILTKWYKYIIAISLLIKKAIYSSAFLPPESVLK